MKPYSLNPGPTPLYYRRDRAPKGYRCSMCSGPLGACVLVTSEVGLKVGVSAPKPHDFWAGFCLKCVGEMRDAAEDG